MATILRRTVATDDPLVPVISGLREAREDWRDGHQRHAAAGTARFRSVDEILI